VTLASGSYVVFYCPLPDCPWQMRETPADQVPLTGPTLDEAIRNGILAAKAAEEKALRAHLAEHPIEEWAAAVVELDRRARAAARAGEVVATAGRWKVQLKQGAIKGIAEADARRIAAEHHGQVYRSTATLYADGGEYLSPWEPA
jgi:hypothetical protein